VASYYVRNDHLGLAIPYTFMGTKHAYHPDFVVRLSGDSMLVLEIKGREDEQDKAKHEAAKRWAEAVSNWGCMGVWGFHVCRDPSLLAMELRAIREMPLTRLGLRFTDETSDT